jgi:hypothetical protein
MMNYQISFVTAISFILTVSASANAANLDKVRQLLRTNTCPDCDLSNADLSHTNLADANLNGAMLRGVDLRFATLNQTQLKSSSLSYALLMDAELTDVNHPSLEKALLNMADVNVFVAQLATVAQAEFQSQANKAREAEARNNIGAVNRGQQAYFIDKQEFATTLDALGLAIATEGENYRYRVMRQDQPQAVIVTAQAKRERLRSYTGAVFVVEGEYGETTVGLICETEYPSTNFILVHPFLLAVDFANHQQVLIFEYDSTPQASTLP